MPQVTVDQVLSLKEVPVPVPMVAIIVGSNASAIPGQDTNLNFQPLKAQIVKDDAALIRLGKAFFWDMQVGSDGAVACATCHNNAGADIRTISQISPGADAIFGDTTLGLGIPGSPALVPNYVASAADFPLNAWAIPTALVPRGPGVTQQQELMGTNPVTRDTNDVYGSQGVRHTQFNGIAAGNALENGTALQDIFNTVTPGLLSSNGRVRRVTGRNAPSVVNAIFNFDSFWDGRASYVFNGCNPFGYRDRTSTIKMKSPSGALQDVFLRVINSSLASQAVGPALSDTEMSFAGRTFPDIGTKLLTLKPLAKQIVDPKDSVLGPCVSPPKKGLTFTTYADMIKAAFQTNWWSSNDTISVGANKYSLMAYNFSMFWGLAIQAYESTLVSDDTPFDRFMGAPSLGIKANPTALNDQQRIGFSLFMDPEENLGAKCLTCHVPPIMSGHTVLDYQPNSQGVPDLGLGDAIEMMVMADNLESAMYDHGMYNIGVRPTADDRGRAGTAPNAAPFQNPLDNNNPFPLSLVELVTLKQAGKLPPDVARFVPDLWGLPRRVTAGAFKVPNLRNIAFTGPYFHNGDSATLRQVVEFYARGGNFPNTNLHDKTMDIEGIPPMMIGPDHPDAEQRIQALVAFLAEGLRDDRVVYQRAPFDHPQLFVPNGVDANGIDTAMEIPAVGKGGSTVPLNRFLNLDPQKP